MANLRKHANKPGAISRLARKQVRSMTLEEVLARYNQLVEPPGPGEKVLFERAEDYTGATINLGEVVATWADHESPVATVLVMGIRTYFPNGKNRAFQGKSRWPFPATHLLRPIEERLYAHALRWEQRAADTREWLESLRGRACGCVNPVAGAINVLPRGATAPIEAPSNILPFVKVSSAT